MDLRTWQEICWTNLTWSLFFDSNALAFLAKDTNFSMEMIEVYSMTHKNKQCPSVVHFQIISQDNLMHLLDFYL